MGDALIAEVFGGGSSSAGGGTATGNESIKTALGSAFSSEIGEGTGVRCASWLGEDPGWSLTSSLCTQRTNNSLRNGEVVHSCPCRNGGPPVRDAIQHCRRRARRVSVVSLASNPRLIPLLACSDFLEILSQR